MDEQQQIIDEFLVEALENLDKLDQDLVALEADPSNSSTINRIFRVVHTFKGTCGFLGFSKLESISHVGENLLDSLRSGKLLITQDITTALLKLSDALRSIIGQIEKSRVEGDTDYSALRATLARLNSPQPTGGVATAGLIELTHTVDEPAVAQVVEIAVPRPGVVTPVAVTAQAAAPADDLEAIFMQAQAEFAGSNTTPITEVPKNVLAEVPPVMAAHTDTTVPPNNTTEAQSTPPAAPISQRETRPPSDDEAKSALADTSLRVDVGLLDQLMNLVGELVLARNQILQFTKKQSDSEFVSTSQRLNLITSELQEQVMRTRMQPIANVWNKFPRVVRDVAKMCGKQVRIEMEGKETDLDKTIIEAIKDPLTHIVRNSVDHGIETPDERIKKGKNPEGVLRFHAFHEGGSVIIEIADDGAGLNTPKIRAKAVERGLISAEKAAAMSDQEANKLIFLPGFSTADQVTNISGRGVGMDVVRSNIEKIGGSFDLKSVLGAGTTLRIKIPLTLAIVPALLVSCGKERFAIPQVSLVELVRVEEKNFSTMVENINGSSFYRLRGNLLPLVFLSQELKFTKKGEHRGVMNIVVMRAEDRAFGLVVEVVHDTEEIVVKPLSKQLKHLNVFAGATIMGDGHVALILDVLGIARRAHIVGETAQRARREEKATTQSADADPKEALLILQAGKNVRAAVPLSAVQRLEEFPDSMLECAGGGEVVQYRGGILPLVDLPQLLTGTTTPRSGERQVIVFSSNGRSFGCVVERIVDIVEDTVRIQVAGRKPGVRGSAIIQKQVTDILDIEFLLKSLDCHTQITEASTL